MTMRTTGADGVRDELGRLVAAMPVAPGSPAGTRPARPTERRGPVRPGGRRGGSPLPPARPAVGAGGARAPRGAAAAPSRAVARRRRVAALALALVAALAVGLLWAAVASPDAAASGGGPSVVTVVGPGESLQDVARRVVPGADERAVATRIRELNDLPTSSVPVGRPVVVPASP